MPSSFELPPQAVREDIKAKLAALVAALQAHPSFTPPEPPRGLFHVWDFVNRSKYIMDELENIRLGNPVRHPDQIPKNEASSSEERARLAFVDVVTRSGTTNEIIQNPRMLMMLGMSQIDFGDSIRTKSAAVAEAVVNATTS